MTFTNIQLAQSPLCAATALRGNILDEFGWGEYLIWHLEPGSKVFIDGRYDSVYSEAIVNQYLDLDLGHPDGLEVLSARTRMISS